MSQLLEYYLILQNK